MTLTPSLTPSLAAPSADTVTATLLAAKKAKGLTFTELGSLLGRDEVWVASLFYGQSTASAAEAQQLAEALNLDPAITEVRLQCRINLVLGKIIVVTPCPQH